MLTEDQIIILEEMTNYLTILANEADEKGDTALGDKLEYVVNTLNEAFLEDDERDITVAFSGRTVTIHSTGLSSKKVCLIIFGYP